MTTLVTFLASIRRLVRHRLCVAIHGGHELYTSRAATKLSQVCLLCGYETTGWALESRPRFRRHLTGRTRSAAHVVFWPQRRAGGRR